MALTASSLLQAPTIGIEPDLSPRFSDVNEGRFFSEPVAWARAEGIVRGYSQHCFGPEIIATRAEVMAVINAALPLCAKTHRRS